MADRQKQDDRLFNAWPERYDRWFESPIGTLVKHYESELLMDLANPLPGESILDAGCGTGIFTLDLLAAGATVTGLDVSGPMLMRAGAKAVGQPFNRVVGDMTALPFSDGVFDKAVSVTAIEFIENAEDALAELFRVTKKGGIVVVATLNSLSPWAARRKHAAQSGHSLFQKAIFRSPEDLRMLGPAGGVIKTAVHFEKDEAPAAAVDIEKNGRQNEGRTGAFVAARWEKQ
ncbi:MAG: methyltransferase domain-containing protein [Desulfobacterales bacterium]